MVKYVAAFVAGVVPLVAAGATSMWLFGSHPEVLQWIGFFAVALTGGLAGYFLASATVD